jgi:molecular chaperone DnaJ
MSGRGEVGPGGGPAGDLYVEIVERPHDYLVRDGNDLHIQIGISMAHAALGTHVQVEGLDGTLDVDIKAGTQSGATVVLKGKGVTHLRTTSRGDLIIHVEVQTPTKLNREQEDLLKKFADARGEKDGEIHLSNREGGLFGKLRGAFHR